MSAPLTPDRGDIERYIKALFAYAPDGEFVSLRSFYERQNKPFKKRAHKLNGEGLKALCDRAMALARDAAEEYDPVVVCPPIATFVDGKGAKDEDLASGLALSVECDERAAEARRTLGGVIGTPTIVTASGGLWTNPSTGEVEEKRHLHFRLSEPTTTAEEHAKLRELRELATRLVGADATCISIVHPIRLAGSVHRKDPQNPRIARIVEYNPDAEIHLDDARDTLRTLVPPRADDTKPRPEGDEPSLVELDLAALGEAIANPDLPWSDWNRLGMAFYAASGGSEAGREAFRVFSEKSAKSHGGWSARWRHYAKSPPTKITFRSLIRAARQADPSFRLPSQGEAAREDEAGLDGRKLIRVVGGNLHEAAARAAASLGQATLAAPSIGIYRRGNLMVRPQRVIAGAEQGSGGIKRAAGALALAAADVHLLRLRLTEYVRWQRFDKRSGEWVDIVAPASVAQVILAAGDTWNAVPHLAGIVEAPTLRHDETVLDRPGYDAATGLLFDPGDAVFPPVPSHPTHDEALASLEKLKRIYEGFPFTDEASRSVALCVPITTLIRKAVRAAPLHVMTAPKMASGKTLLASVAGYIATGRAPAMMSQAEDPESERKRLLAVLLEGGPLVVIDNVDRPLQSDALCSILTETLFTDRLLGFSKTVTVPTNTTFVATGNNIVVAADLSARAIVAELDPKVERPEEREFSVDLHGYVPEHRAELAVAALTIVRGYLAAGAPCPPGLPVFGRYEHWSRLVREPLVWLGMADPCETRRKLEVRDPVREMLGALLQAWRGVFDSSGQTVAAAAHIGTQTADSLGRPIDANVALRDAMDAVAGERSGINARQLGKFIARHERRIEGGLRFERSGEGHGSGVRWAVLE